jgi:hypothetical protein
MVSCRSEFAGSVQTQDEKMADGEWQMANGEWQMADGRWQMADGE